ncbi:hypothetical protein ACFS5N_10045 [Mucilaginibacter ximonensis]|uniref:Ig-like domain-containing protein n=1 Tax=Mucilaginibacter ximonensis TaxID=538021 RepID=A0ABW5YCQ7_9SPHI
MNNYYKMKQRILTITSMLAFLLLMISTTASAQVASGPSDATTPPPTNATDVAKVLCAGSTISMSAPQDNGVDFAKYHWYKIDANGNKQEVTTITGRTYTEVSTSAGYYEYQVVTENANGCTSPISDVFKIYVLPPLSVTVTSPTSSVCAEAGSQAVLTANVTPATGYVLNYQWTKDGVNISGATSSTYTATGLTTVGTTTYGVTVTYALNSSCAANATKDITITPLPTKPSITAN